MRFVGSVGVSEEGVERGAETAPGDVEVEDDPPAPLTVLSPQGEDLLVVLVPVDLRSLVAGGLIKTVLAARGDHFGKRENKRKSKRDKDRDSIPHHTSHGPYPRA